MYRIGFLSRSLGEVTMPRVITSRWIRANQFSIWLSQDEYVGVQWICTRGCLTDRNSEGDLIASVALQRDNGVMAL